MFKVESNVPVAPHAKRSEYVEFLKELKPGQSFAKTSEGKPVTETHVASLRIAARKLGLGLVTRKQESGGFRVWVAEGAVRKARKSKSKSK